MKKILITGILAVFISSCSVISFVPSEKRVAKPEKVAFSQECTIESTGAVFMNLAGLKKADFFPAGFKICYQGKTLYIDPVAVSDTAKADIIFISHVHADHFSKEDINKLSDENTLIIGPKPVTKKLKDHKTRTVKLHDSFEINSIGCEVVEAYNIKKGKLNIPLHPKSDKNVGYIISCGSTRIWHAGDTDFIPEMKNLENITLALVPVGEGNTAMSPFDAAEAVNLIKPETVIPMHYELGHDREIIFQNSVEKGITVKILSLKKTDKTD